MVNLHTHTIYSDGVLSPIQLLKKLEENRIRIASITDHDSVDAYFDLEDKNVEDVYTGILIPGTEIKCIHNECSIEILGYGIDVKDLKSFLDGYKRRIMQFQVDQFEIIKRQCRELNLKFDDMNLKYGEWAALNAYNMLMKYYEHNSKILGEDSFLDKRAFYRKVFCVKESPLYYSEEGVVLSSKEVVDKIRNAGGLSFLAHIGQYSGIGDKIAFLKDIVDKTSIDGIECYYLSHNEEDTKRYIEFCHNNNLYISGGSDYHGGGLQDVITQNNIDISELDWINKIKTKSRS